MAADLIEARDCPEWMANVMMVKKANGQWRMCVDLPGQKIAIRYQG